MPNAVTALLDDHVAAGDGARTVIVTPSGHASYAGATETIFMVLSNRPGRVRPGDADGSFHHLGREDDFFKVAGLWVSPADVENALLGHPAVADVGVVGLPAPDGLVKPVAFVVPRGDGAALPDALRELAGRKLSPHQRPREIRLVAELPRTATGKLQRFLLREGSA